MAKRKNKVKKKHTNKNYLKYRQAPTKLIKSRGRDKKWRKRRKKKEKRGHYEEACFDDEVNEASLSLRPEASPKAVRVALSFFVGPFAFPSFPSFAPSLSFPTFNATGSVPFDTGEATAAAPAFTWWTSSRSTLSPNTTTSPVFIPTPPMDPPPSFSPFELPILPKLPTLLLSPLPLVGLPLCGEPPPPPPPRLLPKLPLPLPLRLDGLAKVQLPAVGVRSPPSPVEDDDVGDTWSWISMSTSMSASKSLLALLTFAARRGLVVPPLVFERSAACGSSAKLFPKPKTFMKPLLLLPMLLLPVLLLLLLVVVAAGVVLDEVPLAVAGVKTWPPTARFVDAAWKSPKSVNSLNEFSSMFSNPDDEKLNGSELGATEWVSVKGPNPSCMRHDHGTQFF